MIVIAGTEDRDVIGQATGVLLAQADTDEMREGTRSFTCGAVHSAPVPLRSANHRPHNWRDHRLVNLLLLSGRGAPFRELADVRSSDESQRFNVIHGPSRESSVVHAGLLSSSGGFGCPWRRSCAGWWVSTAWAAAAATS